jgi:hypothetical protein
VFALPRVKQRLEASLQDVMVRTERLALTADRNGMLTEVPSEHVALTASDLADYLGMQRVARSLEHSDILEYWKSAPYLLNFMEDYDFKRKFREAIEYGENPEFTRAVRSIGNGLLDHEAVAKYGQIDPANARLRSLQHETLGRKAWQLLWIPPSLPYLEPSGPYANPDLRGFSKRLVFSTWRMVPTAITTLLTYEAERRMVLDQQLTELARSQAEMTGRMQTMAEVFGTPVCEATVSSTTRRAWRPSRSGWSCCGTSSASTVGQRRRCSRSSTVTAPPRPTVSLFGRGSSATSSTARR